eukprot:TRINITY_DN5063_c0_g1_i1.p1 TRINITY_DN5063_c0_g1~~TRINITY_DN5063_c0_g1_i1.p1  ORF type:complete len:402 (-),score=82.37 TRINITY_DN5063_c0_g1_i1:49-1224(-)
MSGVSFVSLADAAPDAGIPIVILSFAGESLEAVVQRNVTILDLKRELAARFELTVFDFQICVVGDDAPAHDSMLVNKWYNLEVGSSPADVENAEPVSFCMVKVPMTLERYEENSLQDWRDIAGMLENSDLSDSEVLCHLKAFLSKHAALINWQSSCIAGSPNLKPLLRYAVESFSNTDARQQCVDELLNWGARVHIRHEQGFLIDIAKARGSAFVGYLELKKNEFKQHEKEALQTWRNVSSKLCGECPQPVSDEEEMTRIVRDFCAKYPEMVNFQNNHAVEFMTDQPHGYFGYAPLLAFAGAHACRRRHGGYSDDANTRKASIEELLRRGARVDVQHGGRTTLAWMKSEGSLLLDWLQEQQSSHMPSRISFDFIRRPSPQAPAAERQCSLQ